MAQSNSAKKRIRQNETHRLRNRSRMSRTRTAVKAVVKAAAEAAEAAPERPADRADRDRAEALYRRAASELDRAAKRRIIHPNAAARKKSRLAKRLAKAFVKAPAAQG